jgi:predicted RNase H-like HicB family nuclease
MRNRYTAVVQRDGKWFIAFCPEVPEANGQGKTRQECLESLAAAIELVLDYKREQGLENAPNSIEISGSPCIAPRTRNRRRRIFAQKM